MRQFLLSTLLVVAAFTYAGAVDRSAFTATGYQLDVSIDRPTHVMAVTGRVTLRNDSRLPQKNPVLQVSSSLAWNGVAFHNAPVEFIGDNYTSDIDHTGGLSEVIVTLPSPVPPGQSVTLDVQYGGTVTLDSTRFTRIGAPKPIASRNDWDQISREFTAIRGLGYVVWYPVSLPAVSLSDGDAVFGAIDDWKRRHRDSQFDASIHVIEDDVRLCIAGTGMVSACGDITPATDPRTDAPTSQISNRIRLASLAEVTPTLAVADYVRLERPDCIISYTATAQAFARDFAAAAELNDTLLNDWLKPSPAPIHVIELTDANANPYQDGGFLFTPLRQADGATIGRLLLPVQVAARFASPHQWIENGVQRFLQALSIEHASGRKAAIDFLNQYLQPMIGSRAVGSSGDEKNPANTSLVSTSDEVLLRGKGAFVFWMLRDMLGDEPLQKALAAYVPAADTSPSYFQSLLEGGHKRDLEWFFDDWVYRDRGLPEFHVESVYARPMLESPAQLSLVTVTVSNTGSAGAEVPVLIQTSTGERTLRILVPAHQKVSARTQIPGAPRKVIVNDDSVPVASTKDSVFEVPPPTEQP